MVNRNDLRIAHLRLDLSAYRRIQYDRLSLSPETRDKALELEDFTQRNPHERDMDMIALLSEQIAELEASGE